MNQATKAKADSGSTLARVIQLDRNQPIPDTVVYDLSEAHKGYRLNKLCNSLTSEVNRKAYQADEDGYLARFRLTDQEISLIKKRDWAGLNQLGGNVYYLMKLAFVVGQGLYRMGAQMKGIGYEEFLASRSGKGAR